MDVWADMGARTQEQARNAAAARKLLATAPLLLHASNGVAEAVAASLGVTVLHPRTGAVELGVCRLPAVGADVMTSSPKGA